MKLKRLKQKARNTKQVGSGNAAQRRKFIRYLRRSALPLFEAGQSADEVVVTLGVSRAVLENFLKVEGYVTKNIFVKRGKK